MNSARGAESRLDKAVKVGQVFAFFVSPLLVAYLGLKAQSNAAEISARKDLVQVAVQVLKEPRRAEDSTIRRWALEILNKNSDVPLPQEAADQLSLPLGAMLNSNPILQLAMQKRPPCPQLDLNFFPQPQVKGIRELQTLCARNYQDLSWLQVFAGMMPRTREEAVERERAAKEQK